MSGARRPISFAESLALAEAEDRLRSGILLKGKVPGALRLGKLLQEHDAECPHRTGASAVAVCLNKLKTAASIRQLDSIKNYHRITMVREGGTIPLPDFSVNDIWNLKRSTRRDLSDVGMCEVHPGFFAADFEFKRFPVRVIMHVHGIIHRLDLPAAKR